MKKTKTISKVRREYNTWVANETLEDYFLRFAAKSFRKWSEFLLMGTALGGISFLALEAIGALLAISFGFSNSFWAIIVVSILIFVTCLPITYYFARYNVDTDLLTRGAGFGYIGSTFTSVIYASFTFIFFAWRHRLWHRHSHSFLLFFLCRSDILSVPLSLFRWYSSVLPLSTNFRNILRSFG